MANTTRSFVVLVSLALAVFLITSCEQGSPLGPSPNQPNGPPVQPNLNDRPAPPAGVSYPEPYFLPNGEVNPNATGPIALKEVDAQGNLMVDTGLTIRLMRLEPWPGNRILNRPFRPVFEACAFPGADEGYSSVQFYLGSNPGKFLDSDYISGFAPYPRGGGCEVFNYFAKVEDGGTGAIKDISTDDIWLDGWATYSKWNLTNGQTIKEVRVVIPPIFLNYQP